MNDDLFDLPAKPSRAARKRELEEKRHLATRLLVLNERELARLDIPDDLRRELAVAKKIGHGSALPRQMRVLQALIDDLDDNELGAKIANLHHQPKPAH